MPSNLPTTIGAALGRLYTIERELGSGGMATVYLADDVKHGRKVAIKVLHPELAATIGPDRFLREIETASRLNHPHILPLYDSGATDTVFYYVMPYVRGESVRQKLSREKQISVGDAISITRHVASALEYSHRLGIIHRDIKPENILLHEGEAMLADFGIALAMQEVSEGRLTQTGALIGTPEYMSPEQLLGEPVGARSDMYSLGCVLYEMLVGESPHRGPTAMAVIANRLTTPATPVRRIRSDVPASIERALMKALAKEVDDRFDSTASFGEALTERGAMQATTPCVAVLPFLNLSANPENEYFADGITEDVIAQLSKIRALKVISRTSVMQFKKREQSLREIGATLGATAILEGSVRRAGDRVRVVAQLIDAETDQHHWAETYDRQLTDIFVIQSDVALHIAAALRAELSRDESNRIKKEPTNNLEAYQLYLQGRQSYIKYDKEGMLESIALYERAIAKDPNYAMAYVGIALACSELGETGMVNPDEAYRRGKAAAIKALEIDGDLGEAHCVLATFKFIADFDWEGAELEFKRALELTPGNADTYDLYGRMCSALQRYDEAIAMLKRAQELDPMAHRADAATALLRAGAYDESLQAATESISLDPGFARGHATVGWAYAKKGEFGRGIKSLETAVSLSPGDTMWLAQLGEVYGMAGETDKARGVLQQLEALSKQRFVSPYHMAYVHTGLGEWDRAMDYLESAYENRSGAMYGIKGSFLFTALHSHPRFKALLRRMNLT